MFQLVKKILFLLNIIYIFVYEFFIYYLFNDYQSFIDRLTKKLSSVNILCVKIFQAFALNNSLIDDNINNKLLKFTDNAPWKYSDIHYEQLKEVINKYKLCLTDSNMVPINSGMISLVFKATSFVEPSKKFIIKMKRKNIETKLCESIDNLLFLSHILSNIPFISKYQLDDLVRKNIETIKHQTNFMEEIDNLNLIRENCKNIKYVKIPNVVREITEKYPDLILMEYIEGIKINEIDEQDYEPFAKLVIKFGLVTTLIHGVTHGDLHSGNILFIKDVHDVKYPHKIGVIDFGIIHKVENSHKTILFDILTQLFEMPPRESAEKLLNSGLLEPPNILSQIPKEEYNNILNVTEEIIQETIFQSKKANQLQIYKFLHKLKGHLSNKILSNIGIRPSDAFVKSQLVIAMAHGITLKLCNDEFIKLMDNCLNELFQTQILLL